MNSYYDLELLANDRVRQYRAEADLERLRAAARAAHVVFYTTKAGGGLTRALPVRLDPAEPPGCAVARENTLMSDIWIAAGLVAAVVILDVLAIRFGYDSRDGFRRDRS